MVKRKELKRKKDTSYYFAEGAEVEFIPSGCTVLDCVLGGGYPIGSITNIVGDKSTGKTLMAIEASANFRNLYPKAPIFYDVGGGETFDLPFAQHLGLPKDTVIGESRLVEDFYDSLVEFIASYKTGPAFYILDSLDALSDKAEQERKLSDGSYGTKAKQVGAILRRLGDDLSKKRCHLLIISQIRDNIGVTFGRKHKRSGGKALDFYAAQVLWLAEVKKLTKTKKKVKRIIGVEIKAKCEKNKVGLPFRECTFPLIFNYGMDDEEACLAFLDECKEKKKIYKDLAALQRHVRKVWFEIEQRFMPTERKYT